MNYNKRIINKKERYEELAEKHERISNELASEARRMGDVIPFGQPILIGHHSETRDRNYRARIHGKMDKAVEHEKKAEYYRRKVKSMESNKSVSSDDPDAHEKLAGRIKELEETQTRMKEFNKALKKNDIARMYELGYTDKQIETLSKPDVMGGVGYARYQLTNNGANIRRLKKRLEGIERHCNDDTTEQVIGDIKIIDNVEENRVQILFPGKPDEETRQMLKRWGFRWSPYNKAWQRQRGNARYATEQVVKYLKGTDDETK